MDFHYFLTKIRDVKASDFLSTGKLFAAVLLSPLYKKRFRHTWLVCEERYEARDNGYWFFQYMTQRQPQRKCVYAIGRDSVDYPKVAELGETVEYGSLRHWILYLTCEYNISSQKGGKPNAALCAFLELNGLFKPKNVFLQHGVIINDTKWLYADCSRFHYFITSAIPETAFIRQRFGYPESVIACAGLARFDNLHDFTVKKNRVLIMPTWRAWFRLKSKQASAHDADFETSEYLSAWKALLNADMMKRLIQDWKLEVVFYPHRNMQDYLPYFADVDSGVTIASWKDYDVQDLLRSSAMLITDYSSVFFDMIYMKKPIAFYQFDEEKFRARQYGEGWFDYRRNAFGKAFSSAPDVLRELERCVRNGFAVSTEYLQEHQRIFQYYDARNSERIYRLLTDAHGAMERGFEVEQ